MGGAGKRRGWVVGLSLLALLGGALLVVEVLDRGSSREREEDLRQAPSVTGKRGEAMAGRTSSDATEGAAGSPTVPGPGGTASLLVLVLDPAGAPAEGARVALEPAASGQRTTDGAGLVVFEGLPPGPYRILARDGSAGESVRLRLEAGEEREVALHLRVFRTCGGIVVDEQGRPLPGLPIRAFPLAWEPGAQRTDAEGRFEFPAENEEIVIQVGRRPFLAEYRGPVGEDLELVVERPASLELTVTYPDGVRAADAVVIVVQQWKNGTSEYARLEALPEPGRFRAERLSPGSWRAYPPFFTHYGVDTSRGALGEILLEAGETGELMVTFPAGTASFRGRVLDSAGGHPISGAEVGLGLGEHELRGRRGGRERRTVTGADGRFAVDRARPEARTLRVDAEGYLPRIVSLTPGAESEVLLTRVRRIRGKVVDERRRPLGDLQLDGRTLVARGGHFDEALESEAAGVWIGAPEHEEVYRALPVGPGDLDLGEVVLARAAITRIQIVDRQDRPVVGARVRVSEGARGREATRRVTETPGADREGRVEIRLRPGTYTLEPEHPRLVRDGHEQLVRTLPHEGAIVLRMRSPLQVFISGDAGGPGRSLQANGGNGSALARSGADGRYRLGPLDAEEVLLWMEWKGPDGTRKLYQPALLDLRDTEELRYDFVPTDFGTLRLRCDTGGVVFLGFEPLPGQPGLSERHQTLVDLRCPSITEGIAPGAYRLKVLYRDAGKQEREFVRELRFEAGRITELDLPR